jgi:hypothetical protein
VACGVCRQNGHDRRSCPLIKEDLRLKVKERDDLADILKIIPEWIYSAVLWFVFTKYVLDGLTPKKPGTEINLAILGSGALPDWLIGEIADIPPGVKMAALIDVSLAALKIKLPEIPGAEAIKETLLAQPLTPAAGGSLFGFIAPLFYFIVSGGGQLPGAK